MLGSTLSRCGQFAAALLLGGLHVAGPTLTHKKVLYLNNKPVPVSLPFVIAKALAGIVAVSALKGVASVAARLATMARTIKALRDQTADEIESDLRRSQFWLNAFVALVTVATGVLVLIVLKPGFGLTQDYIYCFFWGIGLLAAGLQLTPASIKAAVLGA
jgi:hypothetical protein